jgi:hypothetical protein
MITFVVHHRVRESKWTRPATHTAATGAPMTTSQNTG